MVQPHAGILSSLKRRETLTPPTPGMNSEDVLLSKISRTQTLHACTSIGCLEHPDAQVGYQGQEVGRNEEPVLSGDRDLIREETKVLEIVVMGAHRV